MCYQCRERGHYARSCPIRSLSASIPISSVPDLGSNSAATENYVRRVSRHRSLAPRKCWCCGSLDHLQRFCRGLRLGRRLLDSDSVRSLHRFSGLCATTVSSPSIGSAIRRPVDIPCGMPASVDPCVSPVRSLRLSRPPPVKFRWLRLDNGLVSLCL
ncbi:MAG: hypothetical protein GY696_33320 [Gammaproteobacteria bacterium]|nr:hypothetical protein [Gammaproteobacteria bacterium]